MRTILSLCLLSLSRGAPQYSGDQTGSLDAGSLDTIAEIFGTSGKQVDGGYGSGQQTGALSDDVDVLVQVIQESNNEYPNDYVPESAQQVVDKATVEVTQILRIVLTTLSPWGMSAYRTISAIMEQSSLTEQDLLISGMALVV